MPAKVCIVKAMVFPVVMYGCEHWTIKKDEHRRVDAFELWCWRRLLRVSWTSRRSNQSILKEINPEYSLEGLMLKLKLQSFGHLMQRADSLEKTLMLGKTDGRRRRGQQRDGITDSMDMSLSKLWVGDRQGSLACCSAWDCKESDMTLWLNNSNIIPLNCQQVKLWSQVLFQQKEHRENVYEPYLPSSGPDACAHLEHKSAIWWWYVLKPQSQWLCTNMHAWPRNRFAPEVWAKEHLCLAQIQLR